MPDWYSDAFFAGRRSGRTWTRSIDQGGEAVCPVLGHPCPQAEGVA